MFPPKKGINSFWGKHHNTSGVSLAIVRSTPFYGITTLFIDFCQFLIFFEKFTNENSSTIHSFWIFWQKNPGIWWVECGGFWTFFWILAQCAALGRVPWVPVNPWISKIYYKKPLELETKSDSWIVVNAWFEIPNVIPESYRIKAL